MKDQGEVKPASLAMLLHEASQQCSKGTKKILAKAQKAALAGESFIKVKCSEADHKCIKDIWKKMPLTPLVAELRENGFHVDSEWDPGTFFGDKYNLLISW